MTSSDDMPSPARMALARFEADHSSDGRLAQYARSRIAGFWLRQTLTLLGSTILAWFESPWLGLALAALALAGEGFDLALLHRVRFWLRLGRNALAARRLALLGAGLQGLTIALCVALSWRLVPQHAAQSFATAFLISAMINAGLTRSLFAAATDLRMAILFLCGLAMLGVDFLVRAHGNAGEYQYQAASFGLLCYITFLLVRLVERGHAQRRRHELALLKQHLVQEKASEDLARAVEENRRLALVAKHASDSIVIADADGRIEWVNEAFSRTTGYGPEEVLGQRPGALLNHPETDPNTLERLAAARKAQVPARVEILNRTKSGQAIWVETSIIPVQGPKSRVTAWIAVERDISQAKQREEELARARIAAEEAGQAKARFLANMSHEIRTPMNGVIGVAELLSETDLTPHQASYVETILDSGQALLSLINDILDLAKLQSGKAELERRAFSPRAMIEGCLRVLAPAAAKKGLSLRLEGDPPDDFVMGDEGKLRQVVLNLVGNALKFTQRGGVTIRLRPAPSEGGLCEIEVEDTGIGIAPDRVGAIFESFTQADSGIGRQFGGTGLGLTICAMLARQMGGDVAVRSEPGRGASFTFRALLPPAAAPAVTGPGRAPRDEPRLRAGLRVLVAEDNRTNMMILRKMLQAQVHALVEAENGEEAVALCRQTRPDLVLMDISMPVKDGLQAARDIRAMEAQAGLPPCPIIALTANAFGEDREACRQAGMDGFLTKPLSRRDLLAAIHEFCPDRPHSADAIGL